MTKIEQIAKALELLDALDANGCRQKTLDVLIAAMILKYGICEDQEINEIYTPQISANMVIDALGGTAETARACKVSMASVSEWRAKNHIPPARLMYLRLLRPDVFETNTVATDTAQAPNDQKVA